MEFTMEDRWQLARGRPRPRIEQFGTGSDAIYTLHGMKPFLILSANQWPRSGAFTVLADQRVEFAGENGRWIYDIIDRDSTNSLLLLQAVSG